MSEFVFSINFTWKKTPFSVHGRFPSQKFIYQAVPLYWLTVILYFYAEFASENGNLDP